MKTTLLAFASILLAFLSTHAESTPSNFVGNYEGEAVKRSSTGQSFVILLKITEKDGAWSLAGQMNDTNREEGMDHTSNTHWQWAGTGIIRDGFLTFTFSSPGVEPASGSLRRERNGLILTLDHIRYRLKPAKP